MKQSDAMVELSFEQVNCTLDERSVAMLTVDYLVSPAEFDSAMRAKNIAISATACHELQLNRLKGAWLMAFEHAFQDASDELPNVPNDTDDELYGSRSLDSVINRTS